MCTAEGKYILILNIEDPEAVKGRGGEEVDFFFYLTFENKYTCDKHSEIEMSTLEVLV